MQMGGTGTEEERSSSVGPKLVRGERVLGSLGGRQERGAESRRDEGGRPAYVACCKGWGLSVDGLMSGGARQ